MNSPHYHKQVKNLKKHILCWTDRKEYLFRKHGKRTISEEKEFRELIGMRATKWCWLEEYKTCSCTFMALKRDELPGYCQKHGNDKRHRYKLPYIEDQLGYSG